MRWWSRLPLASLVLLAGVVGVVQLREQAGTEAGYLMAGACLVLAGVFSCLEVMRYKEERQSRTWEQEHKEPGEEDGDDK